MMKPRLVKISKLDSADVMLRDGKLRPIKRPKRKVLRRAIP